MFKTVFEIYFILIFYIFEHFIEFEKKIKKNFEVNFFSGQNIVFRNLYIFGHFIGLGTKNFFQNFSPEKP